MVYLNRIYTKSGDAGETGLGDGTRVPKTHVRISAYGGVDELNSVIGVALTTEMPDDLRRQLTLIQNDLFDLGADLCVPETDKDLGYEPLRISAQQVTTLEHWIDAHNDKLKPLTSFILPGGTPAAAHLHVARTVCRRVEIAVQRLAESELLNPQATIYLNRLSDLLFVVAQVCNNHGADNIMWIPGKNRGVEERASEAK